MQQPPRITEALEAMEASCNAACTSNGQQEETPASCLDAQKLNGATEAENDGPKSQTSQAVEEVGDMHSQVLRVRNAGGDVVLALADSEALALTVAKVRALVAEATSRRPEEVILMDGAVVLKQTLAMTDVFASRPVVELQAIVRRLPEVDRDKPLAEQLAVMLGMLDSDCNDLQQSAALQVRKLISKERDPPIDDIIQAGLVPKLVQLLRDPECPKEIQHDAAWALTNVASGATEHVQILLDEGTLPVFISKLSSADKEMQEQCVWGIGNIAGDSVVMRDRALEEGAMRPIVALLQPREQPTEDDGNEPAEDNHVPASLLRNGTWALSNLCRETPMPALEAVLPALEVLPQLLTNADEEVRTDACWAVSYIADGPNDRIEAVVRSGVCTSLVENLSHNNSLVSTPALRAVGNILSGDAEHTDAILQCGAVHPLLRMLADSPKTKIQKEACWSISNITAGTEDQIQAVIDAGLATVLHALVDGDFDVRKEAAHVISNAFSSGSPQQVRQVAETSLAPLFTYLRDRCGARPEEVSRTSVFVLDAVKVMLEKGAILQTEQVLAQNPCLQLLIENGWEQLFAELEAAGATELFGGDELAEKLREISEAFWSSSDTKQ